MEPEVNGAWSISEPVADARKGAGTISTALKVLATS
jgi:hypothetical protein